ncbi:MAG: Arm DNA-binding domain-containing protein [Gammaproteobacteria bacterium]|nr:Arm DNA-binding domain-containing protein [Gammaproteobacteria bacterium]
MPLPQTRIKAAKSRTSAYKMADGGGMYLLIQKNGRKYWRLDYRFRDKCTRRYPCRLVITPYENLKSLPDAAQHFKLEIPLESLHAISMEISDNEAARRVKRPGQTVSTVQHHPKPCRLKGDRHDHGFPLRQGCLRLASPGMGHLAREAPRSFSSKSVLRNQAWKDVSQTKEKHSP